MGANVQKESYKRDIIKFDEEAYTCINQGVKFFKLEMNYEAIEEFDRAIEIQSDCALAYNARGQALAAIEQFNDAFTNYDIALELKPNYIDALFNRGKLYSIIEMYDDAVKEYDKIIKKSDQLQQQQLNANLYYHKGIALNALKKYTEAVNEFDKAIQIRQDYAEAYSRKGLALHSLSKFQDAIVQFDIALELKPNYADVYLNKAKSYLSIGNYLKEREFLRKAKDVRDANVERHYKNACKYRKEKNYEAALEEFNFVLKINGDYRLTLSRRNECIEVINKNRQEPSLKPSIITTGAIVSSKTMAIYQYQEKPVPLDYSPVTA